MVMLYTKNINKGDEEKVKEIIHQEYEENNAHLHMKAFKKDNKTEEKDYYEISQTFNQGSGNVVYVYDDEELVGLVRTTVKEKNKERKGYISNYYLKESVKDKYEKSLMQSLTRELEIALDLDSLEFEIKKFDLKLIGYLIENNFIPTVAINPKNVIMKKEYITRGEKIGTKERIRRYLLGR